LQTKTWEVLVTITIKQLSDEDKRCLQDIAGGMYQDGECYAFAIALNRGLGWPILGLMDGEVVRHVAVYGIDHKLHDVRGAFKQDDPKFGRPFGIGLPYTLEPVTEDDLRAIRPVHERTIRRALRFAECIWPELPWKEARSEKVRAFANELEEVCRRHGVWLRSAYPAAKPIVSEAVGDEVGFIIEPTQDGIAFTIYRQL
jgi:hypothetical protein